MGSLAKFNLCQYGCNIYIETGTGRAISLSRAIKYNCFDSYYSVDLDAEIAREAKSKYPVASISIGRSVDILETWLKNLDKKHKILFFLDAHFPGSDFRGAKYDIYAKDSIPLKEELLLIKKYRDDCEDYIICDDARIYHIDNYQNGNVEWLQVPGGMSFIYEIFPDRQISIDLSDEGYILIKNKKD